MCFNSFIVVLSWCLSQILCSSWDTCVLRYWTVTSCSRKELGFIQVYIWLLTISPSSGKADQECFWREQGSERQSIMNLGLRAHWKYFIKSILVFLHHPEENYIQNSQMCHKCGFEDQLEVWKVKVFIYYLHSQGSIKSFWNLWGKSKFLFSSRFSKSPRQGRLVQIWTWLEWFGISLNP